MVNIITTKTGYCDDEIIIDNESFFENNVSSKHFDTDSIEIMKKVDRAVLIDKNIGKIKTPFGICGISDLSTGCKIVLNYLFIRQFREKYNSIRVIDATQCGQNALEELFRLIDSKNDDIRVLLQHANKLYSCSDRQYYIDNNRHITSLLEI